jgi:hypothetical protein
MEERNYREMNTLALRGLEELFFQLCCCVSFWFWLEIGFGFTYLRTLLNNFFGTNIFLIIMEVFRYFVRQFGGDGDGQKTPHGHPDFLSHMKNNVFSYSRQIGVFAFCERIQLIPMLYPRKRVCGIFW